jgi:hypothetical protein
MSDEIRKDEDTEVEGHVKHAANVEAAADDVDHDVAAHVRKGNVRFDNVRHT